MYAPTDDDLQVIFEDIVQPLKSAALTLANVDVNLMQAADPNMAALEPAEADRPRYEHDDALRHALDHIEQALGILESFVTGYSAR